MGRKERPVQGNIRMRDLERKVWELQRGEHIMGDQGKCDLIEAHRKGETGRVILRKEVEEKRGNDKRVKLVEGSANAVTPLGETMKDGKLVVATPKAGNGATANQDDSPHLSDLSRALVFLLRKNGRRPNHRWICRIKKYPHDEGDGDV